MNDKVERDKALKQAYSAATSTLRKRYQDEFNEAYKAEAAKRGYELSLRPTPEERARQQVQDLLVAHPNLATELGVPIDPAWTSEPEQFNPEG